MVATLVRLRFLLLGNQLRRSPLQIVAVVLGGLYGLGLMALAVAGLLLLSTQPAELARTIVVLAGAALVLGWTLLPVLSSGIDQTVDPSRLAVFPVPRNQLLLALGVSGVLGIPGLVTLIAALATSLAWVRQPGIALIAALCGVIGTVTAVVGSRMLVALASRIGAGRRAREAKTLLVVVPLIILGPTAFVLTGILRDNAGVFPGIAAVVSWTPFGAIWSVPADLALGEVGAALAHAAIGIATPVAFTALWAWGMARALEQTVQPTAVRSSRRGTGFFRLFPGTATGAVAARALTYWVRDPRYAQSLISIPLVPLFVFVYSGFGSDLTALHWVGPVVAVLLSMSIYTDVSYDNTAFALHLQTGVRGRADRLGRVLALAAFAAPVTLGLVIASVAVSGRWEQLPGLLGVCIGILLSGFAVSSIVSGMFAFQVPAPGDNPFKAKPGAGFSLMLSTFATWAIMLALTLPETVLAIVGFATDDLLLGWLSLVVGVVLGGALLVIGVRVGGGILDRRGPELLVQLQRQK